MWTPGQPVRVQRGAKQHAAEVLNPKQHGADAAAWRAAWDEKNKGKAAKAVAARRSPLLVRFLLTREAAYVAVEDVKAPPVDESELDTLACMDPAERALLRLACKACRASKRAEAASASAARAKKKASKALAESGGGGAEAAPGVAAAGKRAAPEDDDDDEEEDKAPAAKRARAAPTAAASPPPRASVQPSSTPAAAAALPPPPPLPLPPPSALAALAARAEPARHEALLLCLDGNWPLRAVPDLCQAVRRLKPAWCAPFPEDRTLWQCRVVTLCCHDKQYKPLFAYDRRSRTVSLTELGVARAAYTARLLPDLARLVAPAVRREGPRPAAPAPPPAAAAADVAGQEEHAAQSGAGADDADMAAESEEEDEAEEVDADAALAAVLTALRAAPFAALRRDELVAAVRGLSSSAQRGLRRFDGGALDALLRQHAHLFALSNPHSALVSLPPPPSQTRRRALKAEGEGEAAPGAAAAAQQGSARKKAPAAPAAAAAAAAGAAPVKKAPVTPSDAELAATVAAAAAAAAAAAVPPPKPPLMTTPPSRATAAPPARAPPPLQPAAAPLPRWSVPQQSPPPPQAVNPGSIVLATSPLAAFLHSVPIDEADVIAAALDAKNVTERDLRLLHTMPPALQLAWLAENGVRGVWQLRVLAAASKAAAAGGV